MSKYTDANILYHAGSKAMKGSKFKYNTQLFEINQLMETAKLQKDLQNGTYTPKVGTRFTIRERGHERYITSAATRDKAVNHVTCDEYLTPLLQKYLQYDNTASQVGKGVDLERRRFEIHLRQYYEREGTNEGFGLFADFSGYYPNIHHDICLDQFDRYLAREITDPAELAEVNGHLRGTFQTFELDVSRFSDKEIARMYQTKVSPTLNCGVPATALTGEKMLRKGADIGNQVSQNAGIFLPLPIDNYIKIVCGIPEHGRYSDDFYALSKDKQTLVDLLDTVRALCKAQGLILNEHKTRICRLSDEYRHLQVCYSLKEDGTITRRINPKSITRERRKLKAYKRLLDVGRITYQEIENAYKSWICAHYRYMPRQQIQHMSSLYRELFGKDPTWKKKGYGRLRWLMAPKSAA